MAENLFYAAAISVIFVVHLYAAAVGVVSVAA